MLKARQQFGKYRIEKLLGQGGFANVYQAYDTIEGVRVALKIPHAYALNEETLRDFRKEIRLTAQLDHPHILLIKNASFIDKHLVIAYALGEQTLAERLTKRLSLRTAMGLTEQILQALAYAHGKNIIHCDVKPENFILFPEGRLRLTDFGISRIALRTVDASGSGTVGYLAPEQAMGRPSFRSDVFSAALLIYRMFCGHLPAWPFEQPLPGSEKLRRKAHPHFIRFLHRALSVNPAKRYRNAEHMLQGFLRLKPKLLQYQDKRRRRRNRRTDRDAWQRIRHQQFKREYGKLLQIRFSCRKCLGPLAETMPFCPWCGKPHRVQDGETSFPVHCPRCNRGMKLDWGFCPWCYSPGVEPDVSRSYSDKRYTARCANPKCDDKRLMPFMRYCPWCHRKLKRKWKIQKVKAGCRTCGWGVLPNFWDYCPWCGKSQGKR